RVAWATPISAASRVLLAPAIGALAMITSRQRKGAARRVGALVQGGRWRHRVTGTLGPPGRGAPSERPPVTAPRRAHPLGLDRDEGVALAVLFDGAGAR